VPTWQWEYMGDMMIYEIQPTITRKEWDIYTNNIPYGIQLTILIYSSTKPEHVFLLFL
jgi:hypothetical protein